ncbi:unnamed protein product [Cylicocyclus nassatus]|uniref:Uncharacterized protein n=1 Tax=Cylicocyclus nassatus TaxID=53992 RepID=A0AA36DSU3_CYLNA|nr:unnamed protein product [Cylicocyclus nassatus]
MRHGRKTKSKSKTIPKSNSFLCFVRTKIRLQISTKKAENIKNVLYLTRKRSLKFFIQITDGVTDLCNAQDYRYRTYLKAETATILLKDIGNVDEVPVTFDMPRKYTVNKKGAQDITITTTGGEKTNFTVVLGVTADGNFCPPMVIFKRKTIPKDTPPGVVVKANCRGWMIEVLD